MLPNPVLNVTKCRDQFSILIILTVLKQPITFFSWNLFFLCFWIIIFHWTNICCYLRKSWKTLKLGRNYSTVSLQSLLPPHPPPPFIIFDLVYNNKSWKTDNKANDSWQYKCKWTMFCKMQLVIVWRTDQFCIHLEIHFSIPYFTYIFCSWNCLL